MKSKKKAKARSKSKTDTKSTSRSKTKTHARMTTKTSHSATVVASPSLEIALGPALKACQEVEVGDIGGFGSPEELEEHEKGCSEQATEFCTNCGKNLCRNHYDLIHRDHDTSGHSTSSSLAQQ